LKRSYRDQPRAGAPGLRFVYLHGSPALLAERLRSRSGHYMPPSLLQSQLDILEPPPPDEEPIELDIAAPAQELVARARHELDRTPSSS